MSRIKVVFGRGEQTLPSLFAGQAWMDAAEAWAADRGVKVAQWRVDQRFHCGDWWYAVAWREGEPGQLGTWEVVAVTSLVPNAP